ncbi:McrC family protein [Candidatus Peregrinibacteria bacterium]|jgi:5-methylcytosine-specific restriction enzyme subunit McrC|nr:McrC family protein [Candidatus Peregrinibacteria bacterium]
MSKETFTISEYGLIGTDDLVEGYNKFTSRKVPAEVFDDLVKFAKMDDGKDVFTFSGNGKYLQAKSYVGTIQTNSGYHIEILPKIYGGQDSEESAQKIFLELLRILYKLPKSIHRENANFQNEKIPILEIFISMFLDEVGYILKKGLKSDYIERQDNLHYLKGKLLVKEQIKRNYIHKEKFYVEYDEYTPNRVENRLIKSTLKYLANISSSFENIRLLRMYQEHIYSVEYSQNYEADFRKCKTNTRGMEHYKTALIWAKIFLKKESFSSFSGETIAFSILYPMEKLFESYMEHRLQMEYQNHQVQAQNGEETFVEDDAKNKLFGVRPDFIIKEGDDFKLVADAKWKIIEENSSFSQNDFYQLFAYQSIYKPKEALRLYYPMSNGFKNPKKFTYFDGSKITAVPINMNDLLNIAY